MPRCLVYLVAISFLSFLLVISLVVPVDFAFVHSQTAEGQFPQSIIASSSTDTTPRLLKLKATQQGATPDQEVSGFNLDTTNAVTAQANSQLLIFVTDSSVGVVEAKAKTASDQFIDLVPSTSPQSTNAFSLANLPAGVYTLDVITQKGNTKAAYEGILVIGQQPATIIEETINRENGDIIIISPDDGPSPSPSPSPPPGPPPDDEGPPPDDEGPPPDDEGPPPDDEGPPPDDEGPPPDDEGPPPDDGNGNGENGNGENGNGENEGSLFG
jgi:hypothetical protein